MVKSIHSEAAPQGESRCGNHDWFGFPASFRISSPTQPSHYYTGGPHPQPLQCIQEGLSFDLMESTLHDRHTLFQNFPWLKIISNYWGTLVVGKCVFRVPALGDECPRMGSQVRAGPT